MIYFGMSAPFNLEINLEIQRWPETFHVLTGIWYFHCHYEFHISMGMTALFIVEDGPTLATSLPPPPTNHDSKSARDELYLQTKKNGISHEKMEGSSR